MTNARLGENGEGPASTRTRRIREHACSVRRRAEAGNLTLEELEFVRAMDAYKRKFDRPFPTWSEVLGVFKGLGYTRD
jgi:hypothetical protein